ncbi:unnamed protein product [Orchesella dallaii]|uniref:Non-structural maintenance of chromosomes element 4 n=1 Tax=Orchesella dallaii TaxID=48710 RepID=A0ABP1QWA6_9HEXA
MLKRGKNGETSSSNEQNRSSKQSSLDLSYMDTEPVTQADDGNSDEAMDIGSDNGRDSEGDRASVLNDEESEASHVSEDGVNMLDTEPFQDRNNAAESCEEDNIQRHIHRPPAESSLLEDSLIFHSETEFEDENMTAGPDITCAPPFEVKRIYSDLIETCKNFEDGMTPESEKILRENIFTGHSLFQQIESTLTESMNESQLNETQSKQQRGKQTSKDSASEVLLACVHTKICAEMLKQKAKSVGVVASSFSIEEFLGSLKKNATDRDGTYSVSKTVKNLAYSATTVSQTAPKFICMFGAVDRDDMEAAKVPEPPVVKEKKVRVRPKDEGNATQMEIINDKTTAVKKEDLKSDAPEALAKDILKSLKTNYRLENETPQSLLDVAYGGDNPSDFIRRAFGVAFVVRDGCIGVSSSGNTTGRETSASLMLKPTAKVSSTSTDKIERQQTIVSYSAKFIKELLESQSKGENN